MRIRPMVPRDVLAGMRLTALVGWNQLEDDWHLFLDANPAGCFVAEAGGEVIGTVASIRYEDVVSWIGMVIVDPAHRRRGGGTGLMGAVMAALSDCETIMLDATPVGQGVYESLGFEPEYGLRRMVVENLRRVEPGAAAVQPVSGGLPPAALELDTDAFGADRGVVLRSLLRRAPALAWTGVEQGTRALCLGRPGARFWQVGPVVARDEESAKAVCSAALSSLQGGAVVMDVPAAQGRFLEWLTGLGFSEQRPFTRMRRGPCVHPGRPEMQFAVTGPEFG